MKPLSNLPPISDYLPLGAETNQGHLKNLTTAKSGHSYVGHPEAISWAESCKERGKIAYLYGRSLTKQIEQVYQF